MSTETTNKKIKIDNGTTFGRTYTDKAIDERLQGLVSTATFTPVKEKANNSLQKPAGLTKTKLVGVGTNGQENIEIGDNLTLANGKLSATGGSSGSEGGISVIELTDKNGTIASTQLGEINANPQNFAFKYNGKILLFTSADSTTYQYCNNTTSSSDNNVMTTSTLLTITLSTGVYTIAENVHNVVANSIHPANGGNLTNIQVGSKVYSIPSGSGGVKVVYHDEALHFGLKTNTTYERGSIISGPWTTLGEKDIGYLPGYEIKLNNGIVLYPIWICMDSAQKKLRMDMYVAVGGTNDTIKDVLVRCIRTSIE